MGRRIGEGEFLTRQMRMRRLSIWKLAQPGACGNGGINRAILSPTRRNAFNPVSREWRRWKPEIRRCPWDLGQFVSASRRESSWIGQHHPEEKAGVRKGRACNCSFSSAMGLRYRISPQ